MKKKFITYITTLGAAALLISACNAAGNTSSGTADSAADAMTLTDSATGTVAVVSPTLKEFWPGFQQAVKESNRQRLVTLTRLPLLGVTAFAGTPEKANSVNADTAIFLAALPDLLSKVPRAQVLDTPADSLLAMEPNEFGEQISGAQALLSVIDKDSKIYLSYAQWAESESKETNQALIFAKVNGNYKLCAVAWRGSIAD